MSFAVTTGIILLVACPILLLVGIPIAISIAVASVLAVLASLPIDSSLITSVQRIFTGMDSFSLLAVPFFILSGVIMNNGGIALKLVNFAKLFSGKIPGALAQTNVLGNMLFGSISGSSVAAAAAIGGVLNPLEEKEGYDKNFSAAVNIASAPIGLLIPPSGILIIYALVSGGTSVSALFMAGYLPGILWGLAVMITAYFIAKKNNYSVAPKMTFNEKFKVFLEAIPSLLLIVVVIGGITAGIFTATEGAAVAVAYCFILSFFFYKSISLKDMPGILLESGKMTAVIMLLIGASSVMSWIMAYNNIPNLITDLLLGISSSKILIFLIMNIMLLIIGTFMDLTPAVLIFTPILLPIAKNFGMDPIHFGIMLITNLAIGNITPPVGSALFIGCKVGKTRIEDVMKYLMPFYIAIIVVLGFVTFVPDISLIIPKLLGLV